MCMEICDDWLIMEYQEHKALDDMMTNLDICEGMEVEFGESGCHMDTLDEEWEHDYLDRMLEARMESGGDGMVTEGSINICELEK